MSQLGTRVVRGPNWCWENQDGGEGHVGTVSKIGTSESPDKTVVIQWDNGSRTICRTGYLNKYDLRVIDNAQIGVCHQRFTCDGCNVHPIHGIRYKCTSCYDYDLCYMCYHGDKHDLRHFFRRFESDKSLGINLLPRLNGRKCELKGIFVGAIVVRGNDWDWGNQDGGEDQCGVVLEIRGWEKKTGRSTANVKWFAANTDIYRLGHKGCCDLQFIESASAGHYYPEHLPVLGQNEEEMDWNQILCTIDLQQVSELENSERTPSMPISKEEQPEEIQLINPTLTDLGSIESAYASKIMQYNKAVNRGAQNVNLVDEFFRLSNDFKDDKVKDMWEIVKYMTQLPILPQSEDIVETKNSRAFVGALIGQGKKYLEERYKVHMANVVGEDIADSGQGLGTFGLVQLFVGIRLQGEYLGLENGTINDRPLWPVVYYCLRAGDIEGAFYCLSECCVPEFQEIISLLHCKLQDPNSPEIPILEESVRYSYGMVVRNGTDPFKRMTWAILGCFDEISEVVKTADDYLWVKLNLVREDHDEKSTRYEDLQHTILEEHGETRYDAFKQPLVYFKLLALTGQFEAAVEFLYRTDAYRVHAAHIAITLHELNLLAYPQLTDSPLLSIGSSDPIPARRLNFALLVKSYVENFEPECLDAILHYLFLLKNCNNSEGQNLFELSVSNLIIETKEYEKILGRFKIEGIRTLGLLDQFTDAKVFAENLAKNLVKKDLCEEAVELYDGVNMQDGLLSVMCKMLSKVAHLESQPGSLRNKLQEKAILLDAHFSKGGCHNPNSHVVISFVKLKGLLTFFDLYRAQQYPEALKVLNNLNIVPLRFEEVKGRLRNLENLVEDVHKIMPYVLLAAMTILAAQCDKIKNTEGPMEKHLQCVWQQANCITNFTESLPDVIPAVTASRLIQMEISMHS